MPVHSSGCPERFTRTVDLYGAEGFARLRAATVTVFGLGGVGTHAALALARSGIGTLRLVDFDEVTPSSLNRSPVATLADLGRPKAAVVAARLTAACPDTCCIPVRGFFHDDSADTLLTPAPDCVVDAIDSLNPKAALLRHCTTHGLCVVSSMGAAGRRDVGPVRTGDLWETQGCPLAARVRRYLRRTGITAPIPCVWSSEPPAAPLPPEPDEPRLDRGRLRNRLASSIVLPGVFGYAVAALAMERIVGDAAAPRV
jgi:tRNA A37 threonylcarbamoyladenosine dehydratase